MVQKVGVILVFLLLLLLQDPAAPRYAPSPCYSFSIAPRPRPGQSWCEVQGQVTGDTSYNYTCSSQKVEFIGPPGMTPNATEAWNQQGDHWKNLMGELRNTLLDNQQNISKAFHSLSLQGSMMCQQESNGCSRAFWEFGFNGQKCLHFDLKGRRWTELNPECRPLKETLDSSRDLRRISARDCATWVKEAEALDTKATPPTDSATPATDPGAAPSNRPVTSVIPVILTCLIILSLSSVTVTG